MVFGDLSLDERKTRINQKVNSRTRFLKYKKPQKDVQEGENCSKNQMLAEWSTKTLMELIKIIGGINRKSCSQR